MVQALPTRTNSIAGLTYKDDLTIFLREMINEPSCQSNLSRKFQVFVFSPIIRNVHCV